MLFLLNDVILSLELQLLTPPVMAQRFHELSLASVQNLGREMYAEDARLQHRQTEAARRLASLIVAKSPQVNAALFVAPGPGCRPDSVMVRLASLDMQLLAQLNYEQQSGKLTAAVADQYVWSRAAAAA